MNLKKHGRIFLNGIIVLTPMIICVWAVFAAVWGLDKLIRKGMQHFWESAPPGIGFLIGLAAIYVVGLLARTWLLSWPLRLAEAIVERIPLVKSLYSAVRDLLQFLGGAEQEERGKPAVIRSEDGTIVMLGLITQERPSQFLPEDEQDRVGVYLPMSYQIGGYTLFVPRDRVEELADLNVEELMKLSMTAGIGTTKEKGKKKPEIMVPVSDEEDEEDNTGGTDGDQGDSVHAEPGQDAGDADQTRPSADEQGK